MGCKGTEYPQGSYCFSSCCKYQGSGKKCAHLSPSKVLSMLFNTVEEVFILNQIVLMQQDVEREPVMSRRNINLERNRSWLNLQYTFEMRNAKKILLWFVTISMWCDCWWFHRLLNLNKVWEDFLNYRW